LERDALEKQVYLTLYLTPLITGHDRKNIYFANHYTFLEAKNDISHVECIRGDEVFQPLPCFN
jgi:hypothetical protein